MIKIFIVSWVLLEWVSTPCPTPYTVDDYGRKTPYGCLVMHGGISRGESHSKEFTDRDSATTFYMGAMKRTGEYMKRTGEYMKRTGEYNFWPSLADVRLDSVWRKE